MTAAGARLTEHARQRCREMRLDTQEVVAVLFSKGTSTRPSRGSTGSADARMATSDELPDVAVVYYPGDERRPHTIVTVVWRTYDDYTRRGATYERNEK